MEEDSLSTAAVERARQMASAVCATFSAPPKPQEPVDDAINEMMVLMAPLVGNPEEAAKTVCMDPLLCHVAVAQGLIRALTADRKRTREEGDRMGSLANVFLAYVLTDLAAMTHLAEMVSGTVQAETMKKMIGICVSDVSEVKQRGRISRPC